MRILLLSDADVFAGTEQHILSLARGLRAAGRGATIACPADSPLARRAADAQVPRVPIERGPLLHYPAVRMLRRMLARGEVDLLHAHNGRTALSAALARRAAGRGAVVFTQHFLAPDHLRRRGAGAWAHRAAHRWVNRSIARFIAVSDPVKQEMVRRGEASDSAIATIANAIDDPASLCQKPAAPVREEFSVPADAPLIACVARLEPEKDVDCLVAALAILRRNVPSARCLIVGEGSERPRLEALLASHALRDRVQLTGFRPDALAIIAACDLLALPSAAEPSGLVLLEAMALGKPVVAMRAGGPAQIVAEGETGLLARPGDVAALAAALDALLADPAKRRSMGEAGRRRFEQAFTLGRMVQETAAVYEQAMARPDAGLKIADEIALAPVAQ